MFNKKRKIIKLIYFVFVLLVLIPLFGVGVGGKAYADTDLSGYTNVLDDLKKDKKFNADEYPSIADDYSLQVIQIAESTAGELFVYVYQPAANTRQLTATQINMSLTEDLSAYDYDDNVDPDDSSDTDNDKWGGTDGQGHGGGGGSFHSLEVENTPSTYLYDLMFINRNGVFAKYKVSNFTVSKDFIRHYNITSIYRLWDSNIDDYTDNDNELNSVYFKVGKLYSAITLNGDINYYCKDINVVKIIDPYVDFLTYSAGVTWGSLFGVEGYKDVHYVAFSTDWKIDALEEADVTYITQSYDIAAFNGGTTYGVKSKPQYVTLKGETDVSVGGFWVGTYTWKKIQTSQDFIKNTGLDSTAKANVEKSDFVLVFLTTDYTRTEEYSFLQGHSYSYSGIKVSNVSILRLKFVSEGHTYNLGALMNQQEGDDDPGNSKDPKSFWQLFIEFCKWLESLTGVSYVVWIIIFLAVPIFMLLGILSIFIPPLRLIFKGIWWGIKHLAIGLWWLIKHFAFGLWFLICLPFKGIYALIQRIRNR